MKFTGFATSCIGKILLVLLCLILGAVLSLGGLALGVYVTLTKEGSMGTISEYANNAGIELEFDDDVKAMSVLSWVTEIMSALGELSTKEIGSLESLLGTDLISRTLEDVLGVSAETVAASTLDKLGETVSNSLSVKNVQDKFGVDFPDMPIFNNQDFLSSPLATAFGNFDEYKLNEILEITDESNSVLKELSNVAIKDIGAATTDNTVKSMLLCQLMTIDEKSSKTLQALKYSCIESQYETDASGNIKEENGKKVYKTKTITENDEQKTVELIGINDKIENLAVKDVVDITIESAVVLRKMRKATEQDIADGNGDKFGNEDLLVTELAGSKVTELIDDTTIGELVDINLSGENKSEPILIALRDTSIKNLNSRIKTLKLSDLFEATKLQSGALGLISANTTIDGIPEALTDVVTNATTATLAGKELIDKKNLEDIDKLKLEQQAFIYNSNIGGMLSKLIKFIKDPIDKTQITLGVEKAINYHLISPTPTEITATEFSSLSEFVASYQQFDSVSFSQDETVHYDIIVHIDETADADYFDADHDRYLIPLFNIKTATAITFDGGTVQAAVYDKTESGMAVSRNQFGYYYSAVGVSQIEKGFVTLIFNQAE